MSDYDLFASLKAGSELVYDHVSYFKTVQTPDRRIMAMSSAGAILTMPDPETGIPAFPTPRMMRRAMLENRLFIRSDPIGDPVRDDARREEATPGEVEACDGWAPLRRRVTRAWDAVPDGDKPMLTDRGLTTWLKEAFDEEEIRARHGRLPCGTTIRTWIRWRGRKGDRRMVDMQSRSGRVPRARRFDEAVIAIAKLHGLAQAKRTGRTCKRAFDLFRRDVARFNRGEKVVVDGVALDLPPHEHPVKAFGREIFRQECRRAQSAETKEAAFGAKARRADYGGGGKAMEPTRFLEVAEQDDTPFPKWFVIDAERRVPVGPATVTLTMDVFTHCFIGWDVTYEKPSISTWMRSLAHCAMPKEVPERFRTDRPGLADICGYITGAVLYDNALQNVSKAVEDAGGDLCHEVRLAGEGQPTHKAHVERGHKTVISLMGEVPGSTFSIPLMRRYGYNPAKHVVVTIEEFRVLLAEAIATYHTEPSDALGGRAPLDVWQEQMALHGLSMARDVDQFLRSIGDVDYVDFGRDGCKANSGLRYSGDEAAETGNAALLADLATALGPSKDPLNPTFRVKIKTYTTDVGFISVWNPHTRRFVHVPCTAQRYAAGRPLWLHERAQEHAKLVGAEFATEEQMIEASTGLVDAIEAIAHKASAREKLTMAKLFDAPSTRRYLGESINVVRVEPSPSGMESIVGHDLRMGVRRDAMVEPQRRHRGGENVERDRRDASRDTAEVARAAAASREQLPEAGGKGRATPAGKRAAATKGRSRKRTAAEPLSVAGFE